VMVDDGDKKNWFRLWNGRLLEIGEHSVMQEGGGHETSIA